MSLSIPRTLVNWWWMKLCECFHCSAGWSVSHSQFEEWISGSFIQSHWPCMTLWPISMFSRILAIPSMAAPAAQAGFLLLNSRVTRAAAARPRWILINRLMYAASAAPRDSSISDRSASSSRPICSTSSSVRWQYSLTSAMAMRSPLLRSVAVGSWLSGCLAGRARRALDVEGALAEHGGDTGLHLLVGLVELLAVAQ